MDARTKTTLAWELLISVSVLVPIVEGATLKRWTRDEYQTIFKAGLLDDARYELIACCIVENVRQGRKHDVAVMRGQKALIDRFGIQYVQSQAPVLADTHNEPEPDLAVFKEVWESYTDSPPASEARLFVEITNTTQTKDRQIKRKIYARNGVPEYWIVDTGKRTVTVHQQPLGDDYASINTYTETQTVTPLAAPDGTPAIGIADLLPPPDAPAE